MSKKGFGGFFIHGRAGLTTEYLSDEWFEYFGFCVEEAKKRGMYVWIYDENGWPSGFAGGKLLQREDYLISSVKYALSKEWDEKATVSFVREKGGFKRVVTPLKRARYVHIYIVKNPSYVDLCNPEVTASFIEETHEKYYARFQAEFGNTIRGVFTDEPQYSRDGTPYSPQLIGYFQEKYGENVLEKLPLLFLNGNGAKQFRFRYYSAINELLTKNYFQKIYEWCQAHNCIFTGHAIDERCFSGQMNCSANVMPFYEYMQMPGIDFLGRFGWGTRLARQAYSVAKQTGRKQVLTETFAMTGWDVTFNELRWIAETQYVGGVNFMCQHLYPYALRGLRRYDHPCMFSPCNPWWEKFGAFNEYFSKLGYMLAESEERVNVAVLHTVKSAYLNWEKPNGYYSIMDEEDGFSVAICQLFSNGIPFDIADESLLQSLGRVENGTLIIGNCRYQTLVLPYCTAIDAHTAKLIKEFQESGGKVLSHYASPIRIDGGEETVCFPSTTSFFDILSASEISFSCYSEKLIASYRNSPQGDFVYIVNRDEKQGHKSGVRVRGMQSAAVFDLITLKTTPIPVRNETAYINVKEGASVILLINSENALQKTANPFDDGVKIGEYTPVYRFPKENGITMDKASWSVDDVRYSEPMLIHEIQEKMMEHRYDGELYLRYVLNVENPPKSLEIRFDYDALAVTVNGVETAIRKENSETVADIKKYVQFGENLVVIKTKFYQRPYVYEVLYGENVTETLLNCLYLDTQLTELFVSGSFYVKANGCKHYGGLYQADDFSIDGKYNLKQSGETVTGGLPFYRGPLEYFLEAEVEEDGDYEIIFHGRYAALEAGANGEEMQDILFGKSFVAGLKAGVNTVRAIAYSGNRNAYGPFHLTKDDISVSPAAYTCQSKYLPADEFDLERYYFTRFGVSKIEIRKL